MKDLKITTGLSMLITENLPLDNPQELFISLFSKRKEIKQLIKDHKTYPLFCLINDTHQLSQNDGKFEVTTIDVTKLAAFGVLNDSFSESKKVTSKTGMLLVTDEYISVLKKKNQELKYLINKLLHIYYDLGQVFIVTENIDVEAIVVSGKTEDKKTIFLMDNSSPTESTRFIYTGTVEKIVEKVLEMRYKDIAEKIMDKFMKS